MTHRITRRTALTGTAATLAALGITSCGIGGGDAATGGFALGGVGDEVEARVDSGKAVVHCGGVVHGGTVRIVGNVGGSGGHAWTPSFAERVSRLTLAWASRSPSTA